MMTMMVMIVSGRSGVSFCVDVSVSGTSVSRVSLLSCHVPLEFLGERKFCAAGEKKETNDETGARARQ
jgi:hypothetical protein